MKPLMLVKVQVSQNDGGKSVLVYNKRRSIFRQFDSTPEILEAVGPSSKAFFFASLAKDGFLDLRQRAPMQDW